MPKPQPRPEPEIPPARPVLANDPPRFLLLEREVEIEYRPQMLSALQCKVNAVVEEAQGILPLCPRCGQPMHRQDTRPVSWLARYGCLRAPVSRYRCSPCHYECRPLLDLLGVEPGRISGALARLLALLAAVAPYPLAARLAWLLLGVTVSPMASGGWHSGWVRQGTPHGGLEPVSCRQPQHWRVYRGGSPGSGVGCRRLQFGDAGSLHTTSAQTG